MKLYHGTSSRFLLQIEKEGIRARGEKPSNYETAPSHPGAVYLTNAYAVYYAANTRTIENRHKTRAFTSKKSPLPNLEKMNWVIFEIDTDKLNPFGFVPDEDFLEQAGRTRDGIKGNITTRTTTYRNHLVKFMGELDSQWIAKSLTGLGNCAYMGDIPKKAITRYALMKPRECLELSWQALDPTITLSNYAICGHKYRNMIKWLFEEPLEDYAGSIREKVELSKESSSEHEKFLVMLKYFDFRIPKSRTGIQIKRFG